MMARCSPHQHLCPHLMCAPSTQSYQSYQNHSAVDLGHGTLHTSTSYKLQVMSAPVLNSSCVLAMPWSMVMVAVTPHMMDIFNIGIRLDVS